jgi:hypothetical protein
MPSKFWVTSCGDGISCSISVFFRNKFSTDLLHLSISFSHHISQLLTSKRKEALLCLKFKPTQVRETRNHMSKWEPSQKGLFRDLPHLHRVTRFRFSYIEPSADSISTSPRIQRGPDKPFLCSVITILGS